MAADIAIPAAPVQPPIARAAWLGILLLALTLVSGTAIRTLFSPLQELAKAELGLTDIQIGLVQGLAASLPIAILSIPLGWLVDHSNRVRILIGLTAIWTIGALLTGFAQEFWLLFLGRMLAGLGSVCSVAVAISLAADLCLPEKRGRSLLFLSMGNVFGAAVAFALGGVIVGALAKTDLIAGLSPWRETSLIFGLGSALLLLPLFALREPARMEVGVAGTALGPALKELWGLRAFLAPLFIGQIGVVMADTAATVWAAPVLMRSYGQSPEQFAGWMGASILFCGFVGSIIGGLAADAGHKSSRRGGVLLGAVVAGAISIPAALFPIVPGVPGFAITLTVLLLAGTVAGLVTSTAVAVLVPNELRGVCLGVFIVISSIVGLGLAPLIVTFGSELMGGEAQLPLALGLTGLVASAASFLGFAQAMRRAPVGA